jgi:hypothetical protein
MMATVPQITELAQRLHEELDAANTPVDGQVLVAVVATLFSASLRTEEGEPTRCQVVFVDPENPDPDPPARIVSDRWQATPIDPAVPMTVGNLVKLAAATDARSSSLAIYGTTPEDLQIWGMVDQAQGYVGFMNFDAESGHPPPGLFVASIEALGTIAVRRYFADVATLRIEHVVSETVDALGEGPLLDALWPGLAEFIASARADVGDDVFDERGHWEASLAGTWLGALSRLLLRARRYGHGGALLLTPDPELVGLCLKHGFSYGRLRDALRTQARVTIERTAAGDLIHDLLDEDAEEIPTGLYLDETVADSERRDNRAEIDGAIWTISLLTRIDGLVVLDLDLAVHGFGVEITVATEPETIVRALDAGAVETEPLAYTRWGTRHRSMMRYCWSVPGSVGFVLSQDGDVRAMTRRENELLVWENPLLQVQIREPANVDDAGRE